MTRFGNVAANQSLTGACVRAPKSRDFMHTQVLDDSRPVVMVMKRLGLGSVCSGVECDAL